MTDRERTISKDILFAANRFCRTKKPHFPEFSPEGTENVRRLHESLPAYAVTALADCRDLAARAGVRAVLVKDESSRFGLKAFKGLGSIYAMFRILCRELGLDERTAEPAMLMVPEYRERLEKMVFATTTDGNHGKGVSWAAGVFGCQARVFMPAGSVPVRAQAIRDAGCAEVTITDMRYDDCVRWTREQAAKEGWLLIQDTSWPDYEEVPLWIMQGYTTLYYEALRQMQAMGYEKPTHLFLQAGVGSMAGSIAAAAAEAFLEEPPVIVTAEPREVACFYDSFACGDGCPHEAAGSGKTIMAGLNCAIPCTLAWEILKNLAAGGFSCVDEVTCHGMRLLRESAGIVSGESGAVPAGLLDRITACPEYAPLARKLKLDCDSVVLLINTEGDTDPENYKRITEIP